MLLARVFAEIILEISRILIKLVVVLAGNKRSAVSESSLLLRSVFLNLGVFTRRQMYEILMTSTPKMYVNLCNLQSD